LSVDDETTASNPNPPRREECVGEEMKATVHKLTEEEVLSRAAEIIRRRLPENFHGKVFLFGSRATGTATERSDYDIGVEGDGQIPGNIKTETQWELDELSVMQKIELVDFATVSKEFKSVAKLKVRVLYER